MLRLVYTPLIALLVIVTVLLLGSLLIRVTRQRLLLSLRLYLAISLLAYVGMFFAYWLASPLLAASIYISMQLMGMIVELAFCSCLLNTVRGVLKEGVVFFAVALGGMLLWVAGATLGLPAWLPLVRLQLLGEVACIFLLALSIDWDLRWRRPYDRIALGLVLMILTRLGCGLLHLAYPGVCPEWLRAMYQLSEITGLGVWLGAMRSRIPANRFRMA